MFRIVARAVSMVFTFVLIGAGSGCIHANNDSGEKFVVVAGVPTALPVLDNDTPGSGHSQNDIMLVGASVDETKVGKVDFDKPGGGTGQPGKVLYFTAKPDIDSAEFTYTAQDPSGRDSAKVSVRVRRQFIISIDAQLDANDELVVQDNRVFWHHIDGAAPGRFQGVVSSLWINGAEWRPHWDGEDTPVTGHPNAEVYHESTSTPFILPISLPRSPGKWKTNFVVSGDGANDPQNTLVISPPSASNGYKTIFSTYDHTDGAHAWHMTLTYTLD
jgi:hypothetical protein